MKTCSFLPFRNRDIDVNSRYKVYRNLNNSLFSILAVEGKFKGKVVGHAKCVEMNNVTFIISESSRQRAVKEKTRNVHAFAVGHLTGFESHYSVDTLQQITYNPFFLDSFVFVSNSNKVSRVDQLILSNGKAYTGNS